MKAYSLPELYKYLLDFHEKLVMEQGEMKAMCIVDVKLFLDFIDVSAQKGEKSS